MCEFVAQSSATRCDLANIDGTLAADACVHTCNLACDDGEPVPPPTASSVPLFLRPPPAVTSALTIPLGTAECLLTTRVSLWLKMPLYDATGRALTVHLQGKPVPKRAI